LISSQPRIFDLKKSPAGEMLDALGQRVDRSFGGPLSASSGIGWTRR
jgi:hypothetical protein